MTTTLVRSMGYFDSRSASSEFTFGMQMSQATPLWNSFDAATIQPKRSAAADHFPIGGAAGFAFERGNQKQA